LVTLEKSTALFNQKYNIEEIRNAYENAFNKIKQDVSERNNTMNITIEDVHTKEAITAVRKTIELIGKIKSIDHRYINEIYGYETAFNGVNGRIVVKGGFSSGYQGEGPQGLKRILAELGVNERKIEEYVNSVQKKFTLFI